MARHDLRKEPGRAAAAAPLVGALRAQMAALYRSGDRAGAMQVCRQILAIAPRLADVLMIAGRIAAELGDDGEAVSFYETATAEKHDFAEAHYSLGNALTRLGRIAAAAAAYRRAATHRPDLLPAHNNLGNALLSLERWDEAAEAYRGALALDEGISEQHRNLGIALQQGGHGDAALAAFRRALSLKPDWSRAYSNIANLLLERRAAAQVVETCDRWLAACPGTIEAMGLKSVALDQLGDRAGAQYLVDLERFVRVVEVDTAPPGFAGMDAFNRALTEHALHHPTLTLPPEKDPRYHCPTLSITGEFLAEPKTAATAALERLFEAATRDYLAEMGQENTHHPFAAKPPKRWRLTSWAAVLDRQGNLLPHIHYDGYVSGVYYCRIPAPIGSAEQGQAGWFELGRLPDHLGAGVAPLVRAIEPRAGMMILFPSYFYHRTIPFAAPGPRISIAFDAMPTA
jgi:tetratricopeptide (TPR) repeat protein